MSYGPICQSKLVVKAKGVYGILDQELTIPCLHYEGHEGPHGGNIEFQGGAYSRKIEATGITVPREIINWLEESK